MKKIGTQFIKLLEKPLKTKQLDFSVIEFRL